MDNMDDDSAAKFLDRLSESGHQSPIEHASFTFSVEGVSRSLLAQITRHRIASFSVQSQRYVDGTAFSFVTPVAIQENPYALRIFDDAMDEISRAYRDIHSYLMSEKLKEKYGDIIDHEGLNRAFANNPKHFYLAADSYMDAMIKDPNHTAEDDARYKEYRRDRSAAEKYANENARAVLPNATTTNFVVTMNARELLHFFELRCCNRAQDEIRELANKMLDLVKQVAPNMFKNAGPSCVRGACSEGKMSCGHPVGSDK